LREPSPQGLGAALAVREPSIPSQGAEAPAEGAFFTAPLPPGAKTHPVVVLVQSPTPAPPHYARDSDELTIVGSQALTDARHLAAVGDLVALLSGRWDLNEAHSDNVERIMGELGAPQWVIKTILSGPSPPCIYNLSSTGLNQCFPGFFKTVQNYTFAGPSKYATPDFGKHAAELSLVLCEDTGNAIMIRVNFSGRGVLVHYHSPGTYDPATRTLRHKLGLDLLKKDGKTGEHASLCRFMRYYERVLDLSNAQDVLALEAWKRGAGRLARQCFTFASPKLLLGEGLRGLGVQGKT
jgi:hypothetical protein